jgi:catalase
MQVMPFEAAADYRFNPFDLTKVWPHSDFEPIVIGRMVLDRNPENFFAEVEQAGFSPANLVPGTGLSPDRMLMGRIFSYHDTHLHRIGPNYEQLPINAPKVEVHSYNKDAAMTYRHAGAQPVYAPNSYGGPAADPERAGAVAWSVEAGDLGRYAYEKHAEDDDFGQAGTLYREVMDDTARGSGCRRAGTFDGVRGVPGGDRSRARPVQPGLMPPGRATRMRSEAADGVAAASR